MFSLHFNLCNPAINNRGVLVGKWKLFTRSREDIADIRNFHAGNYCITAVTFCILMQRKNLHELLLVLSSGHTVHWEKLLVTCETNLWSKMQPKCGPFGNCGPGRIHCLSRGQYLSFTELWHRNSPCKYGNHFKKGAHHVHIYSWSYSVIHRKYKYIQKSNSQPTQIEIGH